MRVFEVCKIIPSVFEVSYECFCSWFLERFLERLVLSVRVWEVVFNMISRKLNTFLSFLNLI